MGIDDSVTSSLVSASDRIDIINGLWRNIDSSASFKNIADWDAFLYHYTIECRKAVEYSSGEYTTVRNHNSLQAIAHDLEDGLTKDQLEEKLRLLDTQNRPLDIQRRMAEGSIKLAVRLFSMIDIGPVAQAHFQGRAPLPWLDQHQSLKEVLGNHFQIGTSNPKTSRFDRHFNAFNLRRFAGLEIRWTNNLVDHLRLMDHETKLCIFHHTTFIRSQNSTIFPDGFLQETQQTLALLFPRYDKDTKRWLEHEKEDVQESTYLDMRLLDCDRFMPEDRHIDHFRFWRDRLVALKDLFEQPRPTSISQFWHDDRNKVQWYTFWVAILVLCLTIFFGLVQSIEGAMQVYKAYHPAPG